jgi:hypothetical protein
MCEPLEPRQLLATSGLNAVYFNNRDFTGATSSRIDKSIGFDWPNHSRPAPRVKGTTFAVRWDGLVKPRTSETYTFITRNNDGVRLWVNGKLIIDSWTPSVRATHTGSIALKARVVYDIRLEYFDSTRTAAITLFWKTPTIAQQRIPSTRFFAYDTRGANLADFGSNNANEAAVAKMIYRWKPAFVSTAGDNNYPDGAASTIDRNIGQYFSPYIGNYHGSFGSGASTNLFFPTLGNHDWDTASAGPYKSYFTLPGNERYYDYVQGPIHFFVLDSDPREPDGTSPTSKQGQWLKGKLAASKSPFDVVILHHSPYSSGSEGSSMWMQWPFGDWGADLVLGGHSHAYERLSEGGLTYIVNGAGSVPAAFQRRIVSGSVVRNTGVAGALLIQANELAMTLQYQTIDGKVVDTVTIGAS